ncbi:MAG: nucleotide pyrophosphatase [Acidimicrobiia bacterium]|nr:nucleotide pyrophosphatase [Acidimicrobiia bacterium]
MHEPWRSQRSYRYRSPTNNPGITYPPHMTENAAAGHSLDPQLEPQAEKALEVLLGADLEPIVDMVLISRDNHYEAHSHTGMVAFQRTGPGREGYERVFVEGADPLGDQATDRFSSLDTEIAGRFPDRSDNAYPHAFDSVAQLFDHRSAPDLCVIHSASHNWEDQGGHRGEHGSIGVVQARAPFVIAGKGVRADGLVGRSARLLDVAPTIAHLLGCTPHDDGTYLANQDGEVRDDVLDIDGGRPKHVIGFLFDGTNPNVLYAMAANGEAPNVARLMEMGTAYEHGAMASLPTVTLANHTSILTSRHPGHHGILNNAWWDRATGKQIITNSSATWPTAMDTLEPSVESLHQAISRSFPGEFTASVNEPCDTGAGYSTFEFFRRGEVPPIPKDPFGLPYTTERFVRPSKDYSWSSIVDHMGTEQAVGILSGNYRDESYPLPRFMWVNFTLTDSAMHEGGPHSEMAAASIRDSDSRLGAVLAALEQTGAFDDTAFVLVADHGMEESNPEVRGDWDVHLREAGLKFRDEGYSFLYLDES